MPNSRLYQTAAWVVIVAGIVFVVAVIFFSGAAVAWHRDHPYHHGMFNRGGASDGPGRPPMMPMPGPNGPAMCPMMPTPPSGPGMGPGGPGQPPPPPASPTP